MPSIPYIRVFLSSPGDVTDERQIALQVIEHLPNRPAFRERIAFRVIAWDKPGADTPMRATLSPQEAINKGLPRPSECDIVIVLFWSRMGTPFEMDRKAFLSGTHWELLDALNAEGSETIIYRRTEKITPDPDAVNFDEQIHQYRTLQEFFKSELFYDPQTGQIRRGVNTYVTPDDFRQKFETHFEELVVTLLNQLEKRSSSTEAPLMNAEQIKTVMASGWAGSPFPGLRAFTPDDAPIYFGRGRETDALVRKLTDSRFVAVVGASGSGKSSLVGAGLIPRLAANVIPGSKDWLLPEMQGERDKRQWVQLRFTPAEVGDNPFMALAIALKPLTGFSVRELADTLAKEPSKFDTVCSQILRDQPTWAELLLFIDQFEELFTIVNPSFREPFVNWLVQSVQIARLRVVVTLRADFYHRCVEWHALAKLLDEGQLPLSVPELDALLEMIVRPAERASLTFQDGLPGRILRDTGAEPGALALMAYALDELYHASSDHHDQQLTHEEYDRLGGVQGAIGRRAEKVFSNVSVEAQAALPRVFRDLVDVDERSVATRQRALTSRFSADPAALELIAVLTDARLLIQSRGEDNLPVVEVAHEALLRRWARLVNWITETQDDLRLLHNVEQAAQEWRNNGRTQDFLWAPRRLDSVREMRIRLKPHFDPVTEEFIRGEQDQLIEEIDNPDTSHVRRREIGLQLANITDTRPGVGLRPDGLPDILWCAVPAGKIRQAGMDAPRSYEAYQIAKYPVTYEQYRAFLNAADGYGQPRWWEGLATRQDKPGEQFNAVSNHPANNVSWYDAAAFCRWLNEKLNGDIRLPFEWEWEVAAGSGEFPWGINWNPLYANTIESGLNQSTSVGMFPLGVSPVGALDMSGNVFEWCLNEYGNMQNDELPPTGVPVPSSSFRPRPWQKVSTRALKGGSWGSGKDDAKVNAHFENHPLMRSGHFGFRIMTPKLRDA
jgi:hypothetical protein